MTTDAATPAGEPRDGYFEHSRDMGTSFILVIPLLVVYQAGLLVTGFEGLNGVDFFTVFVVQHFGVKGLLIANLVMVLALIVAAAQRERRSRFSSTVAWGVLLESTVYAWFMGAVIIFVMQKSFLLSVQQMSIPGRVIVSLGAGINEEIVFRLLLLGGLLAVLRDVFRLPASGSIAAAFLVSSVLFSLAHHVGPGGEAFAVYPFVYRTLAGLIFAAIYHVRGLAVAVYTHATYDILVLVFR